MDDQSEIQYPQQQQMTSAFAPPSSRSLSRDELRALGRKAGAAVAGGSLIALGLPLLPMPGPVGETLSIGGMAVLATEFPAAQRVLDGTRDKLVQVLDKTKPEEEDDPHHDDDEDENKERQEGKKSDSSQRCATNSALQQNQAPPPPEGDYFHLHDELLAPPPRHTHQVRHPHRHHQPHSNYHYHHGHHNHRTQGGRRRTKKKRRTQKLKRSLHRSIHGMGTKVVLPLMDTVCTERDGGSKMSGAGVRASTRKAFAGAKSRLRSTIQSLSYEVAAGWREVEEEYAQQALAQAEAARLAQQMRRMQESEEQRILRMLNASNSDTDKRNSYTSASSCEHYEEEEYAEDDEIWETESCPERWIDWDETLWETSSL